MKRFWIECLEKNTFLFAQRFRTFASCGCAAARLLTISYTFARSWILMSWRSMLDTTRRSAASINLTNQIEKNLNLGEKGKKREKFVPPCFSLHTSLTTPRSFADVSRKLDRHFRAKACPCSRPTTRSSSRSHLFPTRISGGWPWRQRKTTEDHQSIQSDCLFTHMNFCIFDTHNSFVKLVQIVERRLRCDRVNQNKTIAVLHVEVPHRRKFLLKNWLERIDRFRINIPFRLCREFLMSILFRPPQLSEEEEVRRERFRLASITFL